MRLIAYGYYTLALLAVAPGSNSTIETAPGIRSELGAGYPTPSSLRAVLVAYAIGTVICSAGIDPVVGIGLAGGIRLVVGVGFVAGIRLVGEEARLEAARDSGCR